MEQARILIAEDEFFIANDLKKCLEEFGYGVSAVVSSGEEAIKSVEKDRPELILMDIKLNGKIDGIEAVKKIKSQFNIPVIYLTAFSDKEKMERVKITEPFGIFFKPFKDRELQTNIFLAIHKHKTENIIREGEERYNAAIKASGQILYDWNSETNEVSYGGDVEKMFGYTFQELKGGLARWQELIHPDDLNHFNHTITCMIGKKESARLEYRVRRKDGSYIYIEDNGHFFKDGKGKTIRMIGLVKEITERVRLDKERVNLIRNFQKSLGEINTLQRLIPVCASCKKIRDDNGFWKHVDEYLVKHTDSMPSHSICPDCAETLYPEFYDKNEDTGKQQSND